MAQNAFPALFVAVLLAGFELGSCVRCFQCNSQSDPSCLDPFAAGRYLTDCHTQDSVNFNRLYVLPIFQSLSDGVTNAPKSCHKIVFQTGTTIRTCLDTNPSDPEHSCRELARSAQSYSGDYSKQLKYCGACDTDGCNGAGSIAASLPLALLTAAISYLFYKQ